MRPKVSILVPVYGVEKFIERCAISLFEQTFDSIEYVFVSDCTRDNSIEVLNSVINRYPKRNNSIKIINHEVNKGLAAARNTGVDNASGDYILHVDSDDYIELDMVEKMYLKAIEDNADIVVCDMILEWENDKKIVNQNFENKIDLLKHMLQADTIVGLVNKLFLRSLYNDNCIRSIEGINLGEDFITTPRLVYYSNVISKVDSPLYHYIQFNANSYTKNITERSIDNIIFVLDYLEDFFRNKNALDVVGYSIAKGRYRKKIELFMHSDKGYWEKIENQLKITNKDFNILPNFNYKCIGYLSNHKSYFLLSLYIGIYSSMFNLYQVLRKR